VTVPDTPATGADDAAMAHEYLVGDLEDVLTRDARGHEPGVHVQVAGGRVVLSGTVSSATRRREIVAVARDHLERHAPDHTLVDDLEVVVLDMPVEVEDL